MPSHTNRDEETVPPVPLAATQDIIHLIRSDVGSGNALCCCTTSRTVSSWVKDSRTSASQTLDLPFYF